MFEKKTTVIIGAGASAEFGLPTGQKVFKELIEETIDTSYSFRGYNALSDGFFKFLIKNNLLDYQRAFEPLLDRAKNSFEQSIDLLTYQNPSTADVSKLFSAWSISKRMYDGVVRTDEWGDRVVTHTLKRNWFLPYLGEEQNWIAALVRRYTQGASSSDELLPGNLSIITFNYDLTLEEAFPRFLLQSERFSDTSSDRLPSIFHVYDQFEAHPDTFDVRWLLRSAQRISYINDLSADDERVRELRSVIESSEAILMIGFAADPANTNLIGLENSNAEMAALCYDGNLDTLKRLKNLGVSEDMLLSGNASACLSVGKACEQGLFSLV